MPVLQRISARSSGATTPPQKHFQFVDNNDVSSEPRGSTQVRSHVIRDKTLARARAPAFQLPGHSNVKAQPTNSETQTGKCVCVYQGISKADFVDRDATLEETGEAERE